MWPWFWAYVVIGAVCVLVVRARYGLKWVEQGVVLDGDIQQSTGELARGGLLLGFWLLLWAALLPIRVVREALNGGRYVKLERDRTAARLDSDPQLAAWAQEIEQAANAAGVTVSPKAVVGLLAADLRPGDRVIGCFRPFGLVWVTTRAIHTTIPQHRLIELSAITELVEQGPAVRVVYARSQALFTFESMGDGPGGKAYFEATRMAQAIRAAGLQRR
jgi:hypothetical protein